LQTKGMLPLIRDRRAMEAGSHNQVGDKLGSGFNGCSMPKQIAVTPGYGNLNPNRSTVPSRSSHCSEQGRCGLCGELDAADVVPCLEGTGAIGAGCGHAVAGQEEKVVDLIVGGQEVLSVPGRPEPLRHPPTVIFAPRSCLLCGFEPHVGIKISQRDLDPEALQGQCLVGADHLDAEPPGFMAPEQVGCDAVLVKLDDFLHTSNRAQVGPADLVAGSGVGV
jgi:hypothetical protein